MFWQCFHPSVKLEKHHEDAYDRHNHKEMMNRFLMIMIISMIMLLSWQERKIKRTYTQSQ